MEEIKLIRKSNIVDFSYNKIVRFVRSVTDFHRKFGILVKIGGYVRFILLKESDN